MPFNLFKPKEVKFNVGDYAVIKEEFINDFPSVSPGLVLKIDEIDQKNALVVFINVAGTHVCKEAFPIKVLARVT